MIRPIVLCAGLLAMSACAQSVAQREDMLAAAGFSFRPADTPRKVAALKALPPHAFVHQVRNGQNVWVYADPTICGCVYAGNDAAYQTYQQEVLQKRIADEQVQAAQMNQDASMDWGAWGPWAPYYGYGP